MNTFEKVPAGLTERPQWVVWRIEDVIDKKTKLPKIDSKTGLPMLTKVPYNINGSKAETDEPKTWASFEKALHAYQRSPSMFNGIGYVFSESDPYTGVDLDSHPNKGPFRCKVDGQFTEEAQAIIDTIDSYTEHSPSGNGVHIIVEGSLPGNRNRTGNYEMYDQGRFFTFTGDHLPGTPGTIEERQDELNGLYHRIFAKEAKKIDTGLPEPRSPQMDDETILSKAHSAKNGEKINALYAGDFSNYDSQSEADQGLCNMLAFYTQYPEQLDRLFCGSGLMRDKWNEIHYGDGRTYGQETLRKAICGLTAWYESKKNNPIAGARADFSIPQDDAWEEPDWFDEYKLPSFPVEVFPDWLSNFVCGVAESTQTPVDASCMAAIASLSTPLSKKIIIHAYGKYTEPVNTFGIVALPPGNRKSAVFQLFQEPIYSYETEARKRAAPFVAEEAAVIESEKKKLERLKTDYSKGKDVIEEIGILARDIEVLEEKRVHLPRFITDDVTPERLVGLMSENGEKMAGLSAEGGIFDIIAGRYSKGKPNLDIFLKGHSGDYHIVDRMLRYEDMTAPALTLGLFIQPAVLHNLPPEFSGRGLMARFLYSFPQSTVGERTIRPEPLTDEVQAAYNHMIRKLMEFEPNETITLKLTAAADQYLKTIEELHEPRLSPNGDLFPIVEWASKQIGQALRIVALLHVAEHVRSLPNIPIEISGSTMKKGLSLIEYFIPHTRKAFDCTGEAGETEEHAKYLWVKLKALRESSQQDYFTKQIVWRAVRGKFKTAEPFDAAIKILIERNYIKVIKDQNGEAGRNANLIFLNPMAIMAKITNKTNEEHKKNNSSHYSHDILQVEKLNLIESDPLQSIEDESLDILI